MRQLLLFIAAALLLAGCATQRSSPPAPLVPPPPMPPLPAPMPINAVVKRQSIRALSVPVAPTAIPDVLAPNYGFAKKISANYEGGKKGVAIEVSWPNWSPTNAYSISVSTNLVKWDTFVISKPTPVPTVIIYDLEHAQFYRINRAWIGTPSNPTPQ